MSWNAIVPVESISQPELRNLIHWNSAPGSISEQSWTMDLPVKLGFCSWSILRIKGLRTIPTINWEKWSIRALPVDGLNLIFLHDRYSRSTALIRKLSASEYIIWIRLSNKETEVGDSYEPSGSNMALIERWLLHSIRTLKLRNFGPCEAEIRSWSLGTVRKTSKYRGSIRHRVSHPLSNSPVAFPQLETSQMMRWLSVKSALQPVKRLRKTLWPPNSFYDSDASW